MTDEEKSKISQFDGLMEYLEQIGAETLNGRYSLYGIVENLITTKDREIAELKREVEKLKEDALRI